MIYTIRVYFGGKKYLKICFWLGSIATVGGVQRVTSVIANKLAEHHEVVVLTSDTTEQLLHNNYPLDSAIAWLPMPKEIFKPNILFRVFRKGLSMVSSGKTLSNEQLYFPIHIRKNLIQFFNKQDFDVIIGVHWYYSLLLAMISRELNAKTIGWHHNSFDAYFNTPNRYAWGKKPLFHKYIAQLDEYVVLNEKIKENMDATFGIDSTVIYNPKSFESNDKVDVSKKVFLAAGRMVYAKGFDTLIDAFKIFAEKNQDWQLLLVGDGEDLPKLKEKIRKYGLENRIITPGKTDNIQQYYLQSSVLLLSSRWEGMPMIVLEGLEMGCPVVAFDIDAMQPLVTDGVEGLIVKEKQDPEKYAQAMLKIAENQGLRESMQQAALKKAELFTIDRIGEEWEKVLRK